MTEAEYIDISNLARLRMLQSAMSWLLPTTNDEHELFRTALGAFADWQKAIEQKTDGLVTG